MTKKVKSYWWRWRERMSSGPGHWRYLESYCDNIDDLERGLDAHGDLSTHSEHYRGIEACKISRPPVRILDREISSAFHRMIDAHEKVKDLIAARKKWYKKTVPVCSLCKGKGKRKHWDTEKTDFVTIKCESCKGSGTDAETVKILAIKLS